MHENKLEPDSAATFQSKDVSESGDSWPVKCVEEARMAHPVPVAVSDALIKQLERVAGERALRGSELATLAQEFLTALNQTPGKEAAL